MGGHGHRNMFYATGLPGWVRFGQSPGWRGLPPAAQDLRDTGQWNAFIQTVSGEGAGRGAFGFSSLGPSRPAEVSRLAAQKEALERSLRDVTRRIEALEEAEAESNGS